MAVQVQNITFKVKHCSNLPTEVAIQAPILVIKESLLPSGSNPDTTQDEIAMTRAFTKEELVTLANAKKSPAGKNKFVHPTLATDFLVLAQKAGYGDGLIATTASSSGSGEAKGAKGGKGDSRKARLRVKHKHFFM